MPTMENQMEQKTENEMETGSSLLVLEVLLLNIEFSVETLNPKP